MAAPTTLLQDIQDSEIYAEWQRQLIDCFYQEEAKDELIRSLRAHLDDQYGSLDEEALEALKDEVVSSLVATAAQEAEPPETQSPSAPAYDPDRWISPSDLGAAWSLLDVMQTPTEQAKSEEDGSEAALILKDGLQRALTALVCTLLADATRLEEIPPRLTSFFASGLVQPTPGKLLDRLRWAASRNFSPAVEPLQAYIDDCEKSNDGWFARLSRLRNKWAHPDDHDVEAVLDTTKDLLSSTPSFVTADVVAFSSGQPYWIGTTTEPFPLSPFLVGTEDELQVPEALEPPDSLQFADALPPSLAPQDQFKSIWHELRVADPELADPTPEEFQTKAERAGFELNKETDPGRLASFPDSASVGLLATPDVRDAVESAFQQDSTSWTALSLSISSDQLPSDVLAERVKLRTPPSFADVCSFQNPQYPYAIFVDLSEVDSEDALQAIYWLADLDEECSPEHLRVVLLRSVAQIESDQDELWDRLPSHLDELLYAPSMNPGIRLSDLHWSRTELLPWHKRLLQTYFS